MPPNAVVEDFEIRSFEGDIQSYQKIKATFRTDEHTASTAQNFILSEHVQSSLSVEQEEIRRMELRVAQEVETLRESVTIQAHEEGLRIGTEEGRTRAYDEEKARMALHLERLAELVEAISTAKQKLAEMYEKTLVNAAFQMAKVIVDREVAERPSEISATVRAILEKISQEDDVRIRLSPANFEVIESIQADISTMVRSGRIQFEADSQIEPGDCIVESQSGEVASFIDDKLRRLRAELDRIYSSNREGKTGT